MPGFFTHYLCGQDTYERINDQFLKDIIIKHRQLFNIGTQGPDILFYHGFWPWTKRNQLPEIGNKIHSHNINIFFSKALKYIKELDSQEKGALVAYICGYLCHYCLDFNTHPYIFYNTGFVRKDEEYSEKYTYYHRLFETTIDYLMVMEKINYTPSKINARDIINLDNSESFSIGRMYEFVTKNTFGLEITIGQIQNAINDMGVAFSILRDRTGLKKAIVSGIESILGSYPLVSSMIYPLKLTVDLDYLNHKHSTWSLPWDKDATCNSSFDDLYDKAISSAIKMCEGTYGYISGTLPSEIALEIIGNRSFSTGVDCSVELDFNYYDLIYE